ncbi:MAG TPA: hypothetical protein ENJ19_11300 [Gammaproteobacteria bacterium]|nr:hypothetical protein [Gammaproteobacteria bacterium]
MVFSTVLGKIYNLNNGYRNVVTIDPLSATVERVAPMAVSSNLLLSPCGRYLIGKGVDRTRDADHVIGRISVMDAETGVMVSTMDFQDVYPSVYRFNADGSRLYVTTAATGKGTQRDNINLTDVLVFDAGQLPELCLTQRLAVGAADCGRRSLAFSPLAGRVFVPNPSDGTLTILDANNELLETVRLSEAPAKEVNFSFWQTPMYGG